MTTPADDTSLPDAVKLAAEAYIYGYPLVYCLGEAAAYVSGSPRFPMNAPYNVFGHARELADSNFKFVSPNNDTLYTIATCDVRDTPLVLHVPDTAGRYYVLQLVDAWSNNFAYIGRRATGTSEQEFLLTPPGYSGAVPAGMQVVEAPTGVFVIVGRTQVNGHDDLPAVHALQDQFTLTPLDETVAAPSGVPTADANIPAELQWWETFRLCLQAFPPSPADAPFLKMFEPLGVTAAESPYANLDADKAAVLVEGQKAGQAKIEQLMQNVHRTPEGWQLATHVFDYNLDHLGLGTIDTPEWKIADRPTAYATRAVAARAGLFGNHGYEAAYAIIWIDADGHPLDGSHRYTLTLDPTPPVDAFWSLTMYDVPEFYLVDNPLNRYSIGDRTPGLLKGADGSVTLYLQAESPGADLEANWLPTPAGPFRPILRMYQPAAPVLDGRYSLPAVVKVG